MSEGDTQVGESEILTQPVNGEITERWDCFGSTLNRAPSQINARNSVH